MVKTKKTMSDHNPGFKTANQAFKNFLEETNQAALPKAERDSLFKKWLQEVKDSGKISSLLTSAQDTLNDKGAEQLKQNTAVDAVKKSFRPLGMHPILFTVVVAGVIWGGYEIYKAVKKGK